MASSASNASRAPDGSGADSASQGQASAPAARPSADVTAITMRDDFLLEVGEALGGQASVRPVDSMSVALESVTSTRRAQIVVIDTRDVTDLRGDLEQISSQAPHVVVLVFASPEAEKQVAAAIKGSNVFALLPVPVDRRKTGAVFDGALAEAATRRTAAREAGDHRGGSVSLETFQQNMGHGGGEPPASSQNKLVLFGGAGLAVVLAAAGAFWFLSKDEAPATSTSKPAVASKARAASSEAVSDDAVLDPTPAVETSIVKGNVDELLEKARFAMRERRYAEPAGDNALLYYRSAVAADGTNAEGIDGLARLATVFASRFDESLQAGRLDEAASGLAQFKSTAPKDERLADMETRLTSAQINKAIADTNLDRAAALVRQAQQSGQVSADQINKWRTDVTRRQEEAKLKRLVDLVNDRIREGRLNDSSDDSAKAYVQQLREAGAPAAVVQRAQRDLGTAYMRKARESAVAGRTPDAERWLAEAKSAGVPAAELNSFQRDVSAAKQRAASAESDRLAQLARERLREGKLIEPAQDSAASYLSALQTADGSYNGLSTLTRELAAKLIDRAGDSMRSGRSAQAEADLTQARRWGADPKDIQAVQQVAAAASQRQQSSTATNARPVEAAPLQTRLKRVRYSPPEFPERALSQKVSGTVTLDYVVDVKGEPRDIRVNSADPPGTFDRAAISAVKRWRYEPVTIEGVPVEVPARTSIRFELPN